MRQHCLLAAGGRSPCSSATTSCRVRASPAPIAAVSFCAELACFCALHGRCSCVRRGACALRNRQFVKDHAVATWFQGNDRNLGRQFLGTQFQSSDQHLGSVIMKGLHVGGGGMGAAVREQGGGLVALQGWCRRPWDG